mmetsp:Transcript_14534/g.26146  ORF Transcript_14534/g.26146 Transcript_14534/m.26146 type:complete len:199 (+) Transcript_14534:83-679(+)
MYKVFETWGSVQRVKTVKPKKGQLRYCGFVNYTYVDEAQSAINALHRVRNHTYFVELFGREIADDIGDGYLCLRFVGDVAAEQDEYAGRPYLGRSDDKSSEYARKKKEGDKQLSSLEEMNQEMRMLRAQLAAMQQLPRQMQMNPQMQQMHQIGGQMGGQGGVAWGTAPPPPHPPHPGIPYPNLANSVQNNPRKRPYYR